uniref:Uncharacterized protein n=1 Tax=Anguilla anguilla TaxID=7936 RepID=A0A0E9XT96_ANGAN
MSLVKMTTLSKGSLSILVGLILVLLNGSTSSVALYALKSVARQALTTLSLSFSL